MKTFLKDPDAILDYAVDWSSWLGADTIAASTWAADAGITVDSDDFDNTSTVVVLSGGIVGQTYYVTNSITTAAGLADDRTFAVKCEER